MDQKDAQTQMASSSKVSRPVKNHAAEDYKDEENPSNVPRVSIPVITITQSRFLYRSFGASGSIGVGPKGFASLISFIFDSMILDRQSRESREGVIPSISSRQLLPLSSPSVQFPPSSSNVVPAISTAVRSSTQLPVPRSNTSPPACQRTSLLVVRSMDPNRLMTSRNQSIKLDKNKIER